MTDDVNEDTAQPFHWMWDRSTVLWSVRVGQLSVPSVFYVIIWSSSFGYLLLTLFSLWLKLNMNAVFACSHLRTAAPCASTLFISFHCSLSSVAPFFISVPQTHTNTQTPHASSPPPSVISCLHWEQRLMEQTGQMMLLLAKKRQSSLKLQQKKKREKKTLKRSKYLRLFQLLLVSVSDQQPPPVWSNKQDVH